jgi:hypothetical protein
LTPASSSGSPVSITRALREDLAELHRAVSEWTPPEIPVYANRFATDAGLLSEGSGRNEALFLGAALRVATEDIIQAGARLAQSNSSRDELIETCLKFFQRLSDRLPELGSGFDQICKAYYDFELDVTRFERSQAEASPDSLVGSLEPPAWKLLIPIFLRNSGHLTEPRSMLAGGVANELSRLSRVYLFETKDLALFTALHSYSLLSQYFRFALMVPVNELSEESVASYKSEYKSAADSLTAFVRGLEATPTDGSEWRLTRDYVAPAIWRWRELFMLYMELGPPSVALVGGPGGGSPQREPASKKAEIERERRRK